jgi:hypothetical protein
MAQNESPDMLTDLSSAQTSTDTPSSEEQSATSTEQTATSTEQEWGLSLKETVTQTIVEANTPDPKDRGISVVIVSIIAAAGTIVALAVFGSIIIFQRYRRRSKKITKSTMDLSMQSMNNLTATIGSHLTESSGATGTTLLGSQSMLYVPGYLELIPGVDYQVQRQIAKGGMGEVWLAKTISKQLWKLNHGRTLCVVKISTIKATSSTEKHLIQEASIGNHLNGCKNIAQTLGYARSPPSLVLAYYPAGSLKDLLYNSKGKFNWISHARALFSYDIASGIAYMHRKQIAHCDIKPQNILIHMDGRRCRAILTDFGISTVFSEKQMVAGFEVKRLNAMSLRYASPEILQRYHKVLQVSDFPTQFLKASDVFAFAATVYEMVHHKTPWD